MSRTKEKNFLDYVSDWFKILLKGGGVSALLVGLGWVSTFFGSLWLGSSWNTSPAFWVNAVVGIMMMVLGYRLSKSILERSSLDGD